MTTAVPQIEVVALRHQLRVDEPEVHRPRFQPADRLLLSALSRLLPRPAWRSYLGTDISHESGKKAQVLEGGLKLGSSVGGGSLEKSFSDYFSQTRRLICVRPGGRRLHDGG